MYFDSISDLVQNVSLIFLEEKKCRNSWLRDVSGLVLMTNGCKCHLKIESSIKY